MSVVHCLWGIDTIYFFKGLNVYAGNTLYIAYEELTRSPINHRLDCLYSCCTLPMRNWHILKLLLQLLCSVVHCLWGIDTLFVVHLFSFSYVLYIAYEELTLYYLKITCFYDIVSVVHCLWGIDTFLHTLFFPRGEKNSVN